MKTSAILLGLAAVLAVCGAIPVYQPGMHRASAYLEETGHVADNKLATKQKLVLQLLEYVHQETKYPELIELGKAWNPEHMIDRYANQRVVKNFLSLWKQGTLPRGELFHVYNDVHLKEVIALFDMMYFAKDFDTFIKTAAWARDNVNEGQFAYALSVAVVHRDDCTGLVLPPLYEVYPHFYINGNDMSEFESAKMQGHLNYVLNTNWTNGKEIMNTEDLIGYFTEDVGLNAYHAYAHLYQPFWMNCEKYGMDTCKNRGEAFYYFYQQLLAHYNLHRMANYLPEMEQFDWEQPIKYGYNPELKYHNGKTFPMRPDNQEISSIKSYTVEDIKNIEARIKDAIDSGYVIGKDGNKISIKNYMQGINILGNIIEGNQDSVNSRYYGSYATMLRNLFALIMDPTNEHGVAPGVIGHYETALRDPAFYYFQEYVNRLFKQYKDNLPSYRPEELYFNGVSVKDVAVDKLVTYFDLFNVDVTRGVDVATVDEAEKLNYVARTMRLNHKPFTYKIKVQSEKKTSAVVRVFLGPNTNYVHSNFYGDASDVYTGQDTQDLDRLRHYFVELDRFPVTLKNGENLIERHSREFTTTVGDVPSYNSLKKMAESGNFYVRDVDSQCGFPDRLVLPMGHKAGMPFSLFVMVTPYGSESEDHSSYYADSAAGHQRKVISCNGLMTTVDNRPLGFPFDREIENFNRFYTPNMYFKDIVIYHKDAKDITSGNVVLSQGGQVVITKNVNDFDHLPKYAAGQTQTLLDEDVSSEDMHM